jgi:hypothetical protein
VRTGKAIELVRPFGRGFSGARYPLSKCDSQASPGRPKSCRRQLSPSDHGVDISRPGQLMEHMLTDGVRAFRLASAERIASLDPSRRSPRGLDRSAEKAINQAAGPWASPKLSGRPRIAESNLQFLTPTGEGTRPRSDAAAQRLSIEAARHLCVCDRHRE